MDGIDVCVRVHIKVNQLNIVLSSPSCVTRGNSKEHLSSQEENILNLWEKCKLGNHDFLGENVIAFLKQVGKFI